MSGRVAIVSGSTSGIGRAVADRLASDGLTVVGASDDADGASRVDVSDRAQVEAFVERVVAEHGRVDVLCNAAGVKVAGTVLDTDLETWERTFAVNVTGVFLLTKAVLPHMIERRSGVVVNIGSPSGYGGANHAAYCASKGALLALGASLALDHRADGIRVNTVVPGSTRTGMNRDRPVEVERELAKSNVAGRINEPEDVANAVAYLCSDAAATVSGAVLEVGWLSGQVVE